MSSKVDFFSKRWPFFSVSVRSLFSNYICTTMCPNMPMTSTKFLDTLFLPFRFNFFLLLAVKACCF